MITPKQALTTPEYFAPIFLRILDRGDEGEERTLIPLRFNKAQQHIVGYSKKKNLYLKARQLGVSTAIQAELFRRNITSTVTTATLAHDDDTTQKLRRMTDRFYQNLPQLADYQLPAKKYANATLSMYADFDSEAVIATGGSKNKGRGGTYTHVHCSEIAFYKDAESIMAGILQGGNPTLYLESTPNGAQGYFYEKCMEAMDGNNDYAFHFFEWWWDKDYRLPLEANEVLTFTDEEFALTQKHHLSPEQIKWRRGKMKELKHLFPQEYPEDPHSCFLLSGTGYFGDVSQACKIPVGSLSYNPSHEYVAGLDFGQTNDYTVCSIIDKTTMQQVAMLRINRLAWAEMRRQVLQLCNQWHVKMLIAEANSMGSTNIEAMQTEIAAEKDRTLTLLPFDTSNLSKRQIMSDLHEALHGGGLLILDDSVQKNELQKMVSKQTPLGAWQIEAASGGHDDTVIALALSLYAANQRPRIATVRSKGNL